MLHLKKVNNYKLKNQSKINIYYKKLLKKFNNKKEPQIKTVFHELYKTYRHLLSTLMKQSKQIYYTKYFENTWNSITNSWTGIKTIISIKNIIQLSLITERLLQLRMFLITTSLL